MLKVEEIINYCTKKHGSYIDFPFGDIPICIKLSNRIFAEIYPKSDNYKITLRCNPNLAELLRKDYPNIIIPGYHVPKNQNRYKNTVYLNKGISTEEIFNMIDHSYEEVLKKLTKKRKNTS